MIRVLPDLLKEVRHLEHELVDNATHSHHDTGCITQAIVSLEGKMLELKDQLRKWKRSLRRDENTHLQINRDFFLMSLDFVMGSN